jgi:hypothetical protein
MRNSLIATAISAVLISPISAHAGLNFTFSFTNDPSVGNTPGTVTGEIFGLTDNSTSAATNVVIFSDPAALVLPTNPYDIFDVPGAIFLSNSFTVSSGQITTADFLETNGNFVLSLGGPTGANYLFGFNATETGTDAGGTYVPAAVPEPASITLLLSGLLGVLLSQRGRADRVLRVG